MIVTERDFLNCQIYGWNSWSYHLVLSLKNHGAAVFISKELTKKEAAIENESLKKRRELINQGQNKKDFSVRDGKLYKWKYTKMETNG